MIHQQLTSGHPPLSAINGLYRTQIAGVGRSLPEAFARLESSSGIERVLRHTRHDSLSARVALTRQEGEGYWELTRIRDDLFIILSNFKYHEARHEIVPGDGLVQFNFKVSGDLTYDVRLPGRLQFKGPGLHLWRQPTGIDMREWTAPQAHERMVTVCVRPEFLMERFLSNAAISPGLQAFLSDGRAAIGFCELPMTQTMLTLILKLLGNPYSGSLYVVYKEALALELLCAAVGLCLTCDPTQLLPDQNLSAVQAARRILEEHSSDPPTLLQLARAVRLPAKNLTRAFKTLYGETVFDFSFRVRMDRALTLLRDHHHSVDEVSATVGYAQPTSFTTAFRRHFGVRPIDIKSRRHRPRAQKGGVVRNS
jgi:AraC-like DNA-binding protein